MRLRVALPRVALVCVLCSVVLLGSRLAPPALAQSTQTSMLVFPIFDIIGGNQTKISITNYGDGGALVRLTFVCQSPGASLAATPACQAFNEWVFFTAHETRVFDVATELTALAANCPTGQGFIVALTGLPCAPSGLACPNEQVSGSYQLFYNGSANSGALCGGVPCAPPPSGPFPDMAAGNAIAIPAPPVQSFGTPSVPSFEVLETSFAAPGAPLIAGPGNPDTVSATELQTTFILLDPYAVFNAANRITSVSMQVWDWLGVGFTTSTQFVCWERIQVTTIDPRFAYVLSGPPYSSMRVLPIPLQGGRPAVLGAVEEVTTVSRAIRPMVFLPVSQP